MKFIEYLRKSFGFYLGNTKSYDYIDKKITWQNALIYTIIFSFILSFISILIESTYNHTSYFFIKSLISIILTTVFLLPIVMILIYGVIHLILKFFNGKANFYDTLKFGLSSSILSTFIFAIINIIPQEFIPKNIIGPLKTIVDLILFAIILWWFIVVIRIYSRLHQLSFKKTALALFLPFILMFGVTLILFLIFIIFLGATF